MTTFEKKYLDGTTRSFPIIADGFVVNTYKNAAGRTSVVVGKIVNEDVRFMSDKFVVERDIDQLNEIKEMLEFEGFELSATIVNEYMKSLAG